MFTAVAFRVTAWGRATVDSTVESLVVEPPTPFPLPYSRDLGQIYSFYLLPALVQIDKVQALVEVREPNAV